MTTQTTTKRYEMSTSEFVTFKKHLQQEMKNKSVMGYTTYPIANYRLAVLVTTRKAKHRDWLRFFTLNNKENETMNQELKAAIEKQAVLDATGHQEEFAGQPITGDWDSQAFEIFCSEFKMPAEYRDAAWVVYLNALHGTVSAIVAVNQQ